MMDTKDQLRALRERRLKAIGKETRMATEYVILEQTHSDGSEQMWRHRGHKEATSAASALRSYLDGAKTGGTFIAIPKRSWHPVSVKVETKTALKFS